MVVALGQHMIHQAGEQLHGHVLEGERGTVEQFEHEAVRAKLHQRTDSVVAECGVCLVDQLLQNRRRDLSADEGREHAQRDLLIGQAAHGANLGGGKLRPFLRQVEAAIPCQSRQYGIGKTETGCFTAGANVVHAEYSVASSQPACGFVAFVSRIFAAGLL
jgi:hypothetical protein